MTTTFKTEADGLTYISKDANATLDYVITWANWLGADTITGAPVWTVDAGLTLSAQSNTTTTATVWLAAGIAGQNYTVACRITTTGGRIDERSFIVRVRNR